MQTPIDLSRTPKDSTRPSMRTGGLEFTLGNFVLALCWSCRFHVAFAYVLTLATQRKYWWNTVE